MMAHRTIGITKTGPREALDPTGMAYEHINEEDLATVFNLLERTSGVGMDAVMDMSEPPAHKGKKQKRCVNDNDVSLEGSQSGSEGGKSFSSGATMNYEKDAHKAKRNAAEKRRIQKQGDTFELLRQEIARCMESDRLSGGGGKKISVKQMSKQAMLEVTIDHLQRFRSENEALKKQLRASLGTPLPLTLAEAGRRNEDPKSPLAQRNTGDGEETIVIDF